MTAAELLGGSASVLDRVIVSRVVPAHVAHQAAVYAAVQPAPHLAVGAARSKRVESTARRLLAAVKCLAVVRQQQARGPAPRAALKLFEQPA